MNPWSTTVVTRRAKVALRTWGSGIAGAVWLVGSLVLSWYVANFGSYSATYGSLGAVIGCMVWMWLSIMVVLVGGEINAELEHQTAPLRRNALHLIADDCKAQAHGRARRQNGPEL